MTMITKHIFSRQIKAYCKKNDVIVFISTSGNSRNIIEGLKQAKKIDVKKLHYWVIQEEKQKFQIYH